MGATPLVAEAISRPGGTPKPARRGRNPIAIIAPDSRKRPCLRSLAFPAPPFVSRLRPARRARTRPTCRSAASFALDRSHPLALNLPATYGAQENVASCQVEVERFVNATAAYRNCLQGQIAGAVSRVNDIVDRFRCRARLALPAIIAGRRETHRPRQLIIAAARFDRWGAYANSAPRGVCQLRRSVRAVGDGFAEARLTERR